MEKAISLEDLYRELRKIEQMMVTKKELNQAIESILVLSNEDTMSQIQNSENDIKAKKIKKISSIADI